MITIDHYLAIPGEYGQRLGGLSGREKRDNLIRVVGFEDFEEAAVLSSFKIERRDLIPINEPNTIGAGGGAIFGEFHKR